MSIPHPAAPGHMPWIDIMSSECWCGVSKDHSGPRRHEKREQMVHEMKVMAVQEVAVKIFFQLYNIFNQSVHLPAALTQYGNAKSKNDTFCNIFDAPFWGKRFAPLCQYVRHAACELSAGLSWKENVLRRRARGLL